MSPEISTLPASAPAIGAGRPAAGTNLATALPRLVMTIDRPVAATSSITLRQEALNFPAGMLDSMQLSVTMIVVMRL